jgi:hypothetical protein
MSLAIELLHQYTRLLDITGSGKNQVIYFTKEGTDELKVALKNKIRDGNIFSMDGYVFTIYDTINKK